MIREILSDFLSMEGFSVCTAEDGRAALLELSRGHFDLVLSDLKMPHMGGLDLLQAVQRHAPNIVTIIMTGFGTVETAIDAMKQGAYDYILKPFKMEEVVHTIRRGLEKQQLQAENLRLREVLSLYKVSEAIAASLSLDQVLQTITDAALHEVDADAVLVLLRDPEEGFFERAREVNPTFNSRGEIGALDPEALVTWFERERPLRVHGEECLPFFSQAPETDRPESFIATRLTVRTETIGFLCLISFTRGRRFDEAQRKLIQIVSNRASAAIENARLYEDLKLTFRQTIRGLANAIDKMDRYTAGHSERVAAYAEMLATKIGLAPDQIEIVRQSAQLHDIGKIGCVLNLNKPGKLSQEEYEIFKQHPDFGCEILKPIEFLHPIVPGVHFHHERWDGGGYPLGLEKQNIPLVARIISVADTYDAMTSDRAYRRALPHTVATDEIARCSGSQFDPDVAHEFLEGIESYWSERGGPAVRSASSERVKSESR